MTDEIVFSAAETVLLNMDLPVITESLILDGSAGVALDGRGLYRPLHGDASPVAPFDLVITELEVRNGLSADPGGCLFVDGGYSLVVERSTFRSCASGVTGGALEIGNVDDLLLKEVSVRDGTAARSGGGLRVFASTGVIEDSTVFANTASTSSDFYGGGGLEIASMGTVTLRRSTVSGNRAPREGGGIRVAGVVRSAHDFERRAS